MEDVCCRNLLMSQDHHYIVGLIDKINETMYHYLIVLKMDEVIWNQCKEGEEDRLYQILLNEEKQNEFQRCLSWQLGMAIDDCYW